MPTSGRVCPAPGAPAMDRGRASSVTGGSAASIWTKVARSGSTRATPGSAPTARTKSGGKVLPSPTLLLPART